MQTYQYQILPIENEQPVQHISIQPVPDWDDFEVFAAQLMRDLGADIKSTDYGMDRHQVDYELDGARYLLHYEHYSQSIWIEHHK